MMPCGNYLPQGCGKISKNKCVPAEAKANTTADAQIEEMLLRYNLLIKR
jgi:hypothetical protein